MGFRNKGPPNKKRKFGPTGDAPEEIVFDEAARQEYLTGFHKRKLQRVKHARDVAIARERDEKIRDRSELRKQRELERENHVKAVNDAIKRFTHGQDGRGWEDSDASEEEDGAEEWNGVTEDPPEINREDEYIDEEKYTTVTVESVAVGKEGLITVGADDESGDDAEEEAATTTAKSQQSNGRTPLPTQKEALTKDKPKDEGAKRKKKKFRYERGEKLKDVRSRQKEKKKKREEGRGESKHRGPAKKPRRG